VGSNKSQRCVHSRGSDAVHRMRRSWPGNSADHEV
jgi:hypothetical protein